MRLATRTNIPVNVRSGATAAALCTDKEGIIPNLNRMNKITKIDEDACLNLTAQGKTSIYQISNKSCRFSDEVIPSLEAAGVDVVGLTKNEA